MFAWGKPQQVSPCTELLQSMWGCLPQERQLLCREAWNGLGWRGLQKSRSNPPATSRDFHQTGLLKAPSNPA